MSGLQITVTSAGRAAQINAENTGTAPVTIAQIGITDQVVVPDEAMTVLPGELKRLGTFAGAAVAADTIHVTIRDDSADVYSMRGFALYLGDGTLYAVYGQADVILEKSAQAMMLLAADILFANIDAASLSFGDTNWINPPATTEVQGVVEIATNAEANTGTDPGRAVTPAGLKHTLDTRFGLGAPSTFVKGLLSVATAALFRAALEIKSAALKDEGAGNGLNADLLDGQHGAHYLAWANQTGVPGAFPPSAHGHTWSELSGVPVFATRWAAWDEVSGKPLAFTPAPHSHDATHIVSGSLHVDRIPELPISKVTDLGTSLASKFNSAGGVIGGANNANPLDIVRVGGTQVSVQFGVDGSTSYFGYVDDGTFRVGATADLAAAGHTLYHAGNFSTVPGAYVAGYGGFKGRSATDANWGLLLSDTGAAASVQGTNYVRLRGGPTALLEVSGAGVTITGAVSASGGFQDGSSRKLKTRLRRNPYGLAAIEQIETRVGYYKKGYNGDGRRRLFLVAEQLQGVIPEAVVDDAIEFNGERVPAVEPSQTIPALIEAVKELSALNRKLSARVQKLEGRRK